MNKRKVGKLIREWQHRLRLMDWRVRFKILKANKGKPKLYARINMKRWEKTAVITIMDWGKRAGAHDDPVEMTIIHELIHLHVVTFEPRKPSREGYDATEAAIDCLAWGFYRAKYPKRKHLYKP